MIFLFFKATVKKLVDFEEPNLQTENPCEHFKAIENRSLSLWKIQENNTNDPWPYRTLGFTSTYILFGGYILFLHQ